QGGRGVGRGALEVDLPVRPLQEGGFDVDSGPWGFVPCCGTHLNADCHPFTRAQRFGGPGHEAWCRIVDPSSDRPITVGAADSHPVAGGSCPWSDQEVPRQSRGCFAYAESVGVVFDLDGFDGHTVCHPLTLPAVSPRMILWLRMR